MAGTALTGYRRRKNDNIRVLTKDSNQRCSGVIRQMLSDSRQVTRSNLRPRIKWFGKVVTDKLVARNAQRSAIDIAPIDSDDIVHAVVDPGACPEADTAPDVQHGIRLDEFVDNGHRDLSRCARTAGVTLEEIRTVRGGHTCVFRPSGEFPIRVRPASSQLFRSKVIASQATG